MDLVHSGFLLQRSEGEMKAVRLFWSYGFSVLFLRVTSAPAAQVNDAGEILHRYAEYLYDVRQTDHDPIPATFRFE